MVRLSGFCFVLIMFSIIPYTLLRKCMQIHKLLGRRQVVTARGFDLRIPGSNPGVPANS